MPAKPRVNGAAKAENIAWWQERYQEDRQRIYETMMQALESVRQQWALCPVCESKVPIEFADIRALNDLAEKYLKFAALMPQPGGDEGGGGLTVRRVIVSPGENGAGSS